VSFSLLLEDNPAILLSDGVGVIEGTAVTVSVPFETDVTGLVASFDITGASVKVSTMVQASGVTPNNFSSPVVYRVIANDGTFRDYTVTVNKVSAQSKEMTSFGFLMANNPGLAIDVTGAIAGTVITAEVPVTTPRGSLVASFTTSGVGVTVAGVPQVSGVTANSFTASVVYRVRASDGTTKDHTVSLKTYERKLTAPDAQAGDQFGSVAISGDYAIVGAPLEDDAGSQAGAAYVFHRAGTGGWDAGVKLTAPDAQSGDNFGCWVAISGDYAIVGAILEDSGGSDAGAAYVFHRNGINSWDTGAKLTAPDAHYGDYFGRSVAICGDYAVVGAYGKDLSGPFYTGAAYVFHRTDTNSWDAGVKLTASDAGIGDVFGISVATYGDYVIIGAPFEDEKGTDAGAAYVFHRTDTNSWDAGVKLMASDAGANDNFGTSVAMSGDYAIVGAYHKDAGSTDAGAAYVFHRTDTNSWDAGVELTASDAQEGDAFGCAVAISGEYAIVGAYLEDSGATDAGAVYEFHQTGTSSWDTGVKLTASDTQAGDWYGGSVATNGVYLLVGAGYQDAGGADAGAVYVYLR
jgi:hypothetical protein